MKFYVESYSGPSFYGRYMVRNTQTEVNTYLCNDGVVRKWALSGSDSGAIAMYNTKECAEEALRVYEAKERGGMKLSNLKTGMMVEVDGKVLKAILGTGVRDVVFVSRSGGYVTSSIHYNDDFSTKHYRGVITKVWEPHLIGELLNNFEPTTQLLWALPVPETVMTISELEEKYDITNLKIISE